MALRLRFCGLINAWDEMKIPKEDAKDGFGLDFGSLRSHGLH